MLTMSTLLEKEPTEYDTHGDILLWEELKTKLVDTPMPNKATEVIRTIKSAINDALKINIDEEPNDIIVIDRFGEDETISTTFWKKTAIPMLVKRYYLVAV